ncbi:hypothetical protein YC2023_083145 [Brassica napus]
MQQMEEETMNGETITGEGEKSITGVESSVKGTEPRKGETSEGSEQRVSEIFFPNQTSGFSVTRDLSLNSRMEIAQFDGENAESWVLRVEQYFELREFTEEKKMKAVRMCFDGEALMWYRWERGRNPFTSWDKMKQRVLEQFAETQDTTAGERLLLLRQTGTVREYCRDFVLLATNAPELPEAVLEMSFMIGLKPKIRAGVKMFEPRTLKKMMSLAKTVEEWTSEQSPTNETTESDSKTTFSKTLKPTFEKRANGPVGGQKPNSFKSKFQTQTSSSPTTLYQGQNNKPQTTTSHGRLKPPFRKLTPAEYAKWRSEGLCYKCDEKWEGATHVCSRKELMFLLVHENGTETELINGSDETVEDGEEEYTEVAELSVNSVVGLSSPHTINLRGSINGVEVVVLIDSGATHNFISESVVQKLGLAISTTQGFGVMVGAGLTVKGKGVCEGVQLQLPTCVVNSNFQPLELGIADVILGVQWLETLGETCSNWKLQRTRFEMGRETITIQGDPSLFSAQVSLKALWKAMEGTEEGLLVEYGGLQAQVEGSVVLGSKTVTTKLTSKSPQNTSMSFRNKSCSVKRTSQRMFPR